MIHVVQPGECLASIASQYGFADYKAIYEHPDNADFKKARPNPNLVFPGDPISIPDKQVKKVDAAQRQHHKFKVKIPKKMLRLILKDHAGKPLANKPCVLSVGGEDRKLTTDGDGKITQPVRVDFTDATLAIGGRVLRLRFGNLNPIAETPDGGVSGVKGRLKNLGYNVADAQGDADDATVAALALFQSENSLEPTGMLDDTTAKKLADVHGS
jgi:N-acetylmuramoyl-L-alanine amidase